MIRRTPLILAIVTLLAIVTSLGTLAAAQGDDLPDSGPAPGAIGQPVAPLAEKRVYDVANLLNDGQEATIEMDADRLARHGIPNVIVIRLDTMPPAEAESFAAEIRHRWSVESSPGADDGLVVLVTVSDTEEHQGIATTMSWGDRALPHYGVTETTSADIQRVWLDRYIDEGYLFEGIDFTLRRLIYHSIYDPPPQEALTGARARLGDVMTIAGVALVAGALAFSGWRWTLKRRRRRQDEYGLALKWYVPALAAAVFALSVAGQSRWGVAAALVMLGIGAADWIARDPRQRTRTGEAS